MFINERDRKVELTKNEYKKAHVYGTEEYKALQEIRKDYPGITPVIKKAKKNNSMGMTIEAIKEIVQTLDAGNKARIDTFNQMVQQEVTVLQMRAWVIENHPEIEKFAYETRYSVEVNQILNSTKLARLKACEDKKDEEKVKKIQSRMIALAEN